MNITTNELWCSDGHFNTDQAELYMELTKKHKPKYCLETGFCTGRSSLSVILGNEDNIEKFISIEYNLNYKSLTKEFVEKFNSKFEFYNVVVGNSAHILTPEFFEKEFPNGIDWFTVDGDHSYFGCKNDLKLALPYMSKNSIIIVDDYELGSPNGCSLPEVTNACNDFYKENLDKISIEKWNKLGKGFCIFRVK